VTNHPNRNKSQKEKQFPWLSEALQDVATEARNLGLAISHYNSGSPRNLSNGTRIFSVADREDGYVDHFRGDHIAHFDDVRKVKAFLAGFKAATIS
jgi:hypothetical protein